MNKYTLSLARILKDAGLKISISYGAVAYSDNTIDTSHYWIESNGHIIDPYYDYMKLKYLNIEHDIDYIVYETDIGIEPYISKSIHPHILEMMHKLALDMVKQFTTMSVIIKDAAVEAERRLVKEIEKVENIVIPPKDIIKKTSQTLELFSTILADIDAKLSSENDKDELLILSLMRQQLRERIESVLDKSLQLAIL